MSRISTLALHILLSGALFGFSSAKAETTNEVCDYAVDSYSRASALDLVTTRLGWVDVNGDGTREYTSFQPQTGTAYVASYVLHDQNGEKLPDLSTVEDKEYQEFRFIGWGSTLRWLPYKQKTYLVGYSDHNSLFPSTLWAVNEDYRVKKVCEFEFQQSIGSSFPLPALSYKAATPQVAVCKDIAEGSLGTSIAKVKLERPILLESATGAEGSMTTADSYVTANISGEGEEKIYLAFFASGRGNGCDKKFYLREKDLEHFKSKNTQDLSPLSVAFYKAQEVDFSSTVLTGDCGAPEPILKSLEGEILLQKGVASGKVKTMVQSDFNLWVVKNDSLEKACKFSMRKALHAKAVD